MNVEELKASIAGALDTESAIDANAVFAEAGMELMDVAEQLGAEQICVDDAFVLGFALAIFLHVVDTDGGVGPASRAVPDLPLTGAPS